MLGPARCFCFAILSPSMPMGSVPQERPVAQSPRLSKDGEFLKESSEAKGAREKASVERAKEKKEEILWKALRTGAAAVQIEQYFRSGPKAPSLHEVMKSIEPPAGSVNKEFLRMVSVVIERFARQRQDVDATMDALIEQAMAGRSWVPHQEIAQLVYGKINPKLPPSRGPLRLSKRDGYFVLSVSNHEDYHALYGEDTEAKKSGGRFHRALHITVAGREVPVIVHPGGVIFNEDRDGTMIHEKQHWMNESLVKLGFIESERPSLLTVPAGERDTALLKEAHHRRIKDEMLAYLREGQVKDMKQVLFGDLYKHLFAAQPSAKREQEDRDLVTKISDEFDRCGDMLVANKKLRTAMVYVLMGVRLRRFPEYLASMRGLLERVSGLEDSAQGDPELDVSDIEMLPTAYRKEHGELLDATSAAGELAQSAWQALMGFGPRDDSRSFLALREQMKVATAQKTQWFEALTRGGVFPPYLMNTHHGDRLLEAEESREQELRTDILDALSSVADASLQNIHRMRNVSEELLIISEDIKAILATYGRIDPVVTFSIAPKGVQVHVHYQVLQPPDSLVEVSNVYVLTRSQYGGFGKTPRARERDFDNAVVCFPDPAEEPKETAWPVRQTREMAAALEEAVALYQDARSRFSRVTEESTPHYLAMELVRDVQHFGRRVEQAHKPFFRNGVHIPDVGWFEGTDLWGGDTMTDPVYRAAEGLRNILFDVASAYPQERIDSALIDIETDADPDATDRVQKQFDALIVKQLGSRQFSSGKIKNIRCGGVYLGEIDGTLGARVYFEVQRRTGGFLPTSVDVIFHRTTL